jgi:hypothetical protein
MRKAMGSGTILIREDALLPEVVRLGTESFATGWTVVKNLDGYGLDRRIREAGWTFFCLAGEISAIAFGFASRNTERRALRRLLANAKSRKFNSLEIARTVSTHFLGVPYIAVFAHSRHIQKSMFLFRDENAQPLEESKIPTHVNPSAGRAKGKQPPLQGTVGEPSVATL